MSVIETLINFFYSFISFFVFLLLKPEVIVVITFIFILITINNFLKGSLNKKESEKSYNEEFFETFNDAERVLEIEKEFNYLDSELKIIKKKYENKLFSFLKK